MRRTTVLSLWLASATALSAPTPAGPTASLPDLTSKSAEYYFTRHDYKQAYQLWSEVLKRDPRNLEVALRVAELKLMFEGRAAARASLQEFEQANDAVLSMEAKKLVRDKLTALQTTFVTDEGQSTFFQALSKAARTDCPGALPLLNQASYLEKGNVLVLKEKAKCEKTVASYDKYYETLKAAYEQNPFDPEVVDNLLEAHVYFRQFDRVMEISRPREEHMRSTRARRAIAYSLGETKAPNAIPALQALVEPDRPVSVHPIVHFELGKLFAAKPDGAGEAITFLERFVIASTRPDLALIDGWDPYRCAEKVEEAQQMLTSLRKL